MKASRKILWWYFCILTAVLGLVSCMEEKTMSVNNVVEKPLLADAVVYLAGGCFWGVEQYFALVPGVQDALSGYSQGTVIEPSYQEVCTGSTGHTETVQVRYDSSVVSLKHLLNLYFDIIDPYSLNKQGNDRGTQYRTGIYYTNEADGQVARNFIAEKQAATQRKIVVEVEPVQNFFPAEEYHQDYLEKNPFGYCHISRDKFRKAATSVDTSLLHQLGEPVESADSIESIDSAESIDSIESFDSTESADKTSSLPSLEQGRYSRPSDEVLQEKLSPLQYEVAIHAATERPFFNEFWDSHQEGLYVDIATGEPLFLSTDKFDSGCGWPSFTQPIAPQLVRELVDRSHGMVRTEVRSRSGDIHLGHVFDDGPLATGGLRYCINSASLRFIPKNQMESAGYGDLLPLLD